MSEKHLTNQRFSELDLDPAVLRGIQEAGFEYCTPIQAEALPQLLHGQDVAGQAKTGTGKTAAFLVALFQHLITHPASAARTDSQPRALVLAPTRELAIQIDKDARLLGKYLDFRLRLAYGGTGYEKQRRDLQSGVDVLVGTPGRIIDYLKQGVFSLDAIQVMVLDEADRMFDLGFIRDIRYLLRRMPEPTERLNMLFSATLSLRVNELAYEHMNNPRVVKIESDRLTVDQVTQRVYFPSNEDKLPLLLGILRDTGDERTLVFVNTRHQSEYVARRLQRSGLSAGVLSGDVPQKKRESLLNRFKEGKIRVLVATDVAARGLHIPDVSLVVNYDLPQDPEDYVHRIGRTARAGAAGDAVSFACETYAFSLPEIEGFIGHRIEPVSYGKEMLVQPGADDSRAERREDRARREGRSRERKGRSAERARGGRSEGKQPRSERADRQELPEGEPSMHSPASSREGAGGHSEASTEQHEQRSILPEAKDSELPREASAEVSREFGQKMSGELPTPAPGSRDKSRRRSGRPGHQRKPGRPPHEVPAVG